MQVRLLLGPAGSGKTFRCLSEARDKLSASPDGPPLLLVAPKQGTYQLEQQLLANDSLAGYTRLFIVSFESLARWIFERLEKPSPQVLTEQGRVMVLRALLAEKRNELKLFRASARLTGFARQLSRVLSDLQSACLSPANLSQIAASLPQNEGLSFKLHDLATLLEQYLKWLADHRLQDQDALLKAAAELLRTSPPSSLAVENLWVDGFAEFSDSELRLLCEIIPRCATATVTFCLDNAAVSKSSWVSHWSPVRKSLERCQKHFSELTEVALVTDTLVRDDARETRLSRNPMLRHLEKYWGDPRPYQVTHAGGGLATGSRTEPDTALRLVSAPDRDSEVSLAAREILQYVRAGARFRDISVLVRKLDLYQQSIERAFSRYQIPFFLDRREPIAHHPLAELTRGAVRVAAFGWQHADWFAALKSGLVPVGEDDIDLLENEALARGWKGRVWQQPVQLKDPPKTEQDRQRLQYLQSRLEKIRCAIVPPFEKLTLALSGVHNRLAGPGLALAIREFWSGLDVQRHLEKWAVSDVPAEGTRAGLSVHETVWRQMNSLLDNAQLAFPSERLALRDWLPILETGLADLTIGVIPPALDQVLVAAVDRSRTPEVNHALVLGLNETVFPSTPEPTGLLTETDCLELEKHGLTLGAGVRQQLGRERYLAYIACTRARQTLRLSWAARDPGGAPLNPSSFVSRLQQLFPQLETEQPPAQDWRHCHHIVELAETLLRTRRAVFPARNDVLSLPGLDGLLESMLQLREPDPAESLHPDLASHLYGPVLRTSVSRMEQFAACPFKFFLHSGLRAEERKLFDLDVKEQGSFQHDVLARFHEELRSERKLWRDITPAQARQRVHSIALALTATFRDGLLQATEETRFTARVLAESLQDFVETLVDWMQQQYLFDPVQVELPFGEEQSAPAWTLDLPGEQRLQLSGRIDRVDLSPLNNSDSALCVVVDYKSSQKLLDPVLVHHGLQLQLLTYLNVLRHWPDPQAAFGVARLEPAGVFYVNLRGKYGREPNRLAALADPGRARKLAYRHAGRFDLRALPRLDSRPGATEGDQFNYRLTQKGKLHQLCKEAVTTQDFETLLNQVEKNLLIMGQQIYAGCAQVAPFRKGALTACDQCAYNAICRFDPWTHPFRVLRPNENRRDTLPTTASA